MIVDSLAMDKFIAVNQLQEVTNPIYLNADKTPTNDGIFSYEIFGVPGTKDRKNLFGYISLGTRLMHPFFYVALTQMDRKVKQCVEGTAFFNIVNGELVKVTGEDEQGHNGINWLYNNWGKLSWKGTGSDLRDKKISIFEKTPRDEIFVDKWLVIPAFYRDLDFSKMDMGRIQIGEENEYYERILSLSKSIQRLVQMDNFIAIMATSKMQNCLVETYTYFVQKPAGKNGYNRKYLLSKNIDYSTRGVITTSKYSTAERPENMPVKLGEFGVPLHMLCSAFKPFIIKNVREFLGGVVPENREVMYFSHKSGKDIKEQKNISVQFTLESLSDDKISAIISTYQKSWHNRWDPLYKVTKDGKHEPFYLFTEKLGKRPFTVTDLLFISASYAIMNKHMWNTRFPVTSMHSTLPNEIVILTTNDTVTVDFSPMKLGLITNYPKYQCMEWLDATMLDNSKCGVLGADFDGDTMSDIPIFSQEANDDSRKILNSKKILVDLAGKSVNNISKEATLSLYMMTKDS
jgi:DNA-directed RNA polymerase beta' subunit